MEVICKTSISARLQEEYGVTYMFDSQETFTDVVICPEDIKCCQIELRQNFNDVRCDGQSAAQPAVRVHSSAYLRQYVAREGHA